MGPIIGIDFGTTNSLCSWMDGDRPSIIPNSRGMRSTPSVVAITAKGEILVGESARNQALINPENTIAGVKRCLAAESLISIGGRAFRPEEIVALILGSLKTDAERHLGREVTQAVITAPAHFSERERRALMEAGRLSGLEVRKILNEPTAAAIARAHGTIAARGGHARSAASGAASCGKAQAGANSSSGGASSTGRMKPLPEEGAALEAEASLILVYDFGGGTFDVTLLRQVGPDCTVLSSRGDGRLGGGDIDRELFRRAILSFKEEEGLDVESDRLLVQSLMDQAERAKIELSERSEASMSLPFAVAGSGTTARVVHPVFTIPRADFEALARPFVERSLDLTARVLSDAGLEASQVDVLVLSGGSSRIPLVQRMIAERFALKPSGGVNPEEIVALGAAVAASLEGGSGRLRFRDVVSRTYGVEIDGGSFVPLIRKNSPVPATKSRTFTTVEDGQDSVEIHVLQGESKRSEEDLSLGRFLLSGIRPARAGEPRISVDFAIDESDILHVSAIDLDTGSAQAISIADLGRGVADEAPEELLAKAGFLSDRITSLKEGLCLESALEAELEEAVARARKAQSRGLASGPGEAELRLLKAELEGLVGELLARRGEAVRS